jgi:xanthine dehydrogenase accessory factor
MEIVKKISQLKEANQPFAVATVVEVIGSAPQRVGSKMIVLSDGSIYGTVGGGKIEFEVIKEARSLLRYGQSGLREFVLRPKGLGMLCGGKMKIFIEIIKPRRKLIIVGAGHIGLALYQLARILDFDLIIIDSRREFANKDRFPQAIIKVGNPKIILKKVCIDKNTFIAIATHNHKFDYVSLKAVVNSSAFYIGMIGSRSKVGQTLNLLMRAGISKMRANKVHTPIGLDLGGDSPQEIALSILSEITAEIYGKSNIIKSKKVRCI